MPDSTAPAGPSTPPQPTPPRSAVFLAALATSAVPGLDVVATRHPRGVEEHVEYTGILDSSGRSWVVRAPRTVASGAALEAEWALLAALAEATDHRDLPFDVARPTGFADLPEGGRAVVHPDLPGRELPLHELAPGPGLSAHLGRSLAALHEVDTAVIGDAGIPVYTAEECRTRLLGELDVMAQTGRIGPEVLRRWETALEDVRAWRFQPTFVHGDLAPERVLADRDGVLAITDFTAAHVGDPAVDLAWLMAAAPEDALESVLEAYALHRGEAAGSMIVARAQLLSELALGRWLLHGLRLRDSLVTDEAEAMLADLAIAVDGAAPIIPR
ncbi:aminoglycoside phosphotransferase [Serinibacter arcticus]|uniref:Aminoglycoside phosphotransferase n=1 Tax=Serinibacter arcticus TaxID=1655435 RepID=A0A2U1ZTL0_9MICO|nr:phosphotransferase [Serinibacter arcticus]PWD50316.1 aminoglycoside phosphotransferase [Serinibacter arcticus]